MGGCCAPMESGAIPRASGASSPSSSSSDRHHHSHSHSRSPQQAPSSSSSSSVPSSSRKGGGGANLPLKTVQFSWRADPPLTREELRKQRTEFWETRPAFGGKSEMWLALKAACEAGNLEEAQTYLTSANIILPTGYLSEAYDELGYRYEIPNFCICEPANLILDGVPPTAAASSRSAPPVIPSPNTVDGEKFLLKIRLSTEKDLRLEVTSTETIAGVKKRVFEVENVAPTRQRAVLMGRILHDNTRLYDTQLAKGTGILQILIT